MRSQFTGWLVAAAAVIAVASWAVTGQAPNPPAYRAPRTADGKPDLSGIWQAVNAAAWDIQAHGAQDGVPAGLGVVEGSEIPYQAWAAAKKKENYSTRANADPLNKCFLPGVPRITYVPFPFEISQTLKYVGIAYEYVHATRTIAMDGTPHSGVDDLWLGDSRGHWEGETLVVDVNGLNDKTWFDKAGNFHSDALHVVERYTRPSPDVISYEVTIEDPKVFTRSWKMSMPLYRRQEKNIRILEYDCLEFREPFVSIDELSKTHR
jgi:hypothetical protein